MELALSRWPILGQTPMVSFLFFVPLSPVHSLLLLVIVLGSQFMITLAPAHQLDGKYPIFGRLESGMQTLQKISLVATDSSDK